MAENKPDCIEELTVSAPLTVPVLGLIGGIGAGKSRVADALARRGGRVISGDAAGHEALRQAEIKAQVVKRWGREVLSPEGEIDRRSLAQVVFTDPRERAALEALVFPYIERRLREQIAQAAADPAVAFVVLDAAVMLEAGWNRVCTWLIFVEAPRDLRLDRLAHQRGWTPEDVEARERAQWPLAQKKAQADYVVDNSGSPEDLDRQVEELLKRIKPLVEEARSRRTNKLG